MGWHLILARDGSVVAVIDGAPVTWIGTRLEECAAAHEDLKAAAVALIRSAAHSPSPVESTVAHVPVTVGTVPTDSLVFFGLLVGTAIIVGALTYFPALALGPIIEHFLMLKG